jgi:hypothetical protein
MSYFLKSGNTFKVSTKESMDLHERLPVGNYTVGFDKMAGIFFLEKIDDFNLTGKIYGNPTRYAERILNTFKDRTAATGVMLTGEKGSGKTMLTKKIAIEAAKEGIPTIVINQPWCGEGFNAFIQMIDQPTIVIFDEFEKTYDTDDQEKMLTLLDGVYPSKKLFLITTNDKWRIDRHMRNRPGRIFYMIDFKGVDAEFITEYCEDNLKAKEHIEKICQIATLFSEFNFDMLKALVEDMNRYNETPQESLRLLNAKPEFSEESKYKVELQIGGIEIDGEKVEQTEWHGNPLTRGVNIDYKVFEVDSDGDENWDWENVRTGDRLVLTKVTEKTYYHYDAL